MTTLARVAVAAGATWVLQVDADELWVAADPARTLADVLDGRRPRPRWRWSSRTSRRRATCGASRPTTCRASGTGSRRPTASWPTVTSPRSRQVSTPSCRTPSGPSSSSRGTPDVVVGPGGHTASGRQPGPVGPARSSGCCTCRCGTRTTCAPSRGTADGCRSRASGPCTAGSSRCCSTWSPTSSGTACGARTASARTASSRAAGRATPSSRTTCSRGCPSGWRRRSAGSDAAPAAARARARRGAAAARRRAARHRGERTRLAETTRLLADAHERLAWVTGEAHRARAAAEAHQAARAAEVAALRAEVDRREREIDALRATASWRLTRPLRAFTRGRWAQPPGPPLDDTAWAAPLVDAEWYLATYPDVAASGQDAVEHYARWGHADGHLPRPPEPV